MTTGLTSTQARTYLEKYGPNQLPDKAATSFFDLLIAQFKNYLTLILIVASALSFVIGDQIDGFLILSILLLNVSLGFWQEYKASQELQALRKLEVATSRVIRNGEEIRIATSEIVPKDIVLLEAGDNIPADGVLIESYDLTVNESALTGESLPVVKSTRLENNIVLFGTTVATGRGRFEVKSTGVNTRFGKIALTLTTIPEEPTPLELALNNLAKKIGLAAFLVCSLLLVLRIYEGSQIGEAILASIALLVAAVPEGLPTVITVLLASSVARMYKRKTLIRRLSAIESLGTTNVICTDKTGTLTKNQMQVKEVVSSKKDLGLILKAAVICNSAALVIKEDHGTYDILGDTTEGSLLIWAKDNGLDIELVKAQGKIKQEIPFSLNRRMMTVVWEEKDQIRVFCKGAPEAILPLCQLSDSQLSDFNHKYKKLASNGLRVLAFASKNLGKKKLGKAIEANLNLLGLVGIADAPREEARETISRADRAGIKVVMVTGDNELTAKAIAEEIGLLKEGETVLTGEQLDQLTDEELAVQLDKIRIFARVVPEHKLRIVQAFQKIGQVVATTGDGVNDALALKQAQVGIAMGQTGTDVAKEASDIIILDDNLATIMAAIEQGRVTYSNITKVVRFLMTGNLAEVLVIVGAAVAGLPNPLLPVQILWINFVTDGLPALSLAADPADPNIMSHQPRDRKEMILNDHNTQSIFIFALVIAIVNLGLFALLFDFYDLPTARTVLFSLMIASQMVFIFLIRPHHRLTSNKYLLGSVALVLLMQLLIISLPTLRTLFKI